MLLASAGVTVKLSGVNNVDIEFVSPRYAVDVDAVLLQPATITIASARIAITVEIESVFILFMQFESGSLSVITATFTGPRQTSMLPKAARPAAPCATYCYHAICLGGGLPDLIFCVSGLFVNRFKFQKPQIDHGCYGRNEKAYQPIVVEAGFR